MIGPGSSLLLEQTTDEAGRMKLSKVEEMKASLG
jgi:hypothetical protein